MKGEGPKDMLEEECDDLDELACSTIMLTLAENVYFNVAKDTTTYMEYIQSFVICMRSRVLHLKYIISRS